MSRPTAKPSGAKTAAPDELHPQLLVSIEDAGLVPSAPSEPPLYRGEWVSLQAL